MKLTITEDQSKILNLLKDENAPIMVADVVDKTGIGQAHVMGFITFAKEKGWVTLDENPKDELLPSEEAAALLEQGLPERQILPLLVEKGSMPMKGWFRSIRSRYRKQKNS